MLDALYWVGVAVAILVGIFLVIMVVGVFLPRYHQVSRSVELKQSPETLWQTITAYGHMPEWQKNLVAVQKLDDRNGHEVWREVHKGNYGITLETTEAKSPQRLVRHIADVNGPFSGRWEFELTPTPAGCRVAITEFGDIPNPFFRFMARLFMNPAFYLEIYLHALAQKYGEAATITGE